MLIAKHSVAFVEPDLQNKQACFLAAITHVSLDRDLQNTMEMERTA